MLDIIFCVKISLPIIIYVKSWFQFKNNATWIGGAEELGRKWVCLEDKRREILLPTFYSQKLGFRWDLCSLLYNIDFLENMLLPFQAFLPCCKVSKQSWYLATYIEHNYSARACSCLVFTSILGGLYLNLKWNIKMGHYD